MDKHKSLILFLIFAFFTVAITSISVSATYCCNADCCGCIVPCPGCCWDACCTKSCCDDLPPDGEGEGEPDPCAGVTCPDKCEGSTRLYSGSCSNGDCVYSQQNCPYGCANGQCRDPDNSQALCVQFGFTWLGNMCCGDDDYNNPKEFVKTSWDGREIGCCRSENQCLVSQQGSSGYYNEPLTWFTTDQGPRCIGNNQYILDHLCEQGKWTSRTSYVAVQLLHEAIGDYILFCGEYEDTLNYYSYVIANGDNILLYLQEEDFCLYEGTTKNYPCVNNFCVLVNPEGQIEAFGSSLNPGMSVGKLRTMLEYGKNCGSYEDDQFHQCGLLGGELWYNSKYQIFIYGLENDQPITLDTGFDFKAEHNTLLKNPFNSLMNDLYPEPRDDFIKKFVNNAYKYNDLYLAQIGSKSVLARKEGIYEGGLMLIKYENFDTNICLQINAISPGSCIESNGLYYIKAQQNRGETEPLFDWWTKLTAELRINATS